MAIIKKFSSYQNLSNYNVLVNDTNPNSDYFRITEFNETFTGGKNAFLIEGSPFLKETTEVKIEILDVEGNPVYYEPGDGIPEYYEGLSKVVSVLIYSDTPIGLGKITILGEAKQYLNINGILEDVPDEWKGAYNVKWERTFQINRNLQNETIVRFYKRPQVNIIELVKPIFNKTIPLKTISGSVSGEPIQPGTGTNLTTWRAGTVYRLTKSSGSWDKDIDENPISINVNGNSYTPTIIEVLNNSQVLVDIPYTENNLVQPFTSQSFISSFLDFENEIPGESSLTGSFAKIDLTQLKTFAGDVARVKIYRRSRNEVGDFQFVQESRLESTELLRDITVSDAVEIPYGNFSSDVLDTYWITSSVLHPITVDSSVLSQAVKVDFDNEYSDSVQRLITSQSFNISKDVEYEISFKTLLSGSATNPNYQKYLKAYLTGSFLNTNNQVSQFEQNFVFISGSGVFATRQNVSQNILAEQDITASLAFEFKGDDWYLSQVSLKNAQETSFSPDEFTLVQSIPRKLEKETFDFRFEFYDINNNYIPVDVTATKEFDGGNDYLIGGTSAKILTFESDRNAFRYASGSASPAQQTILFQVTKTNLTGSILYTSQAFDEGGTLIPTSSYTQYPGLLTFTSESLSGQQSTLTVSNFEGDLVSGSPNIEVYSIIYTATCENLQEFETVFRVEDGDNAPQLLVTSNANQFIYEPTTLSPKPSGQSITVRAQRKNLESLNSTITITSGSNLPPLTVVSDTGGIKTYSISALQFSASFAQNNFDEVTYNFSSPDVFGVNQTDQITLSKVINFDAVSFKLSNSNHTFTAKSTDEILDDITTGNGSVTMFVAGNSIPFNETGLKNTFEISNLQGIGCTPIGGQGSDPSINLYGITSMSLDSASLDIEITYTAGDGTTTQTFPERVTYTKSKKAAPNIEFQVTPTSQTIEANSLGSGSSVPQFLTVTAREGSNSVSLLGLSQNITGNENGLSGNVNGTSSFQFNSTASSMSLDTGTITLLVSASNSEGVNISGLVSSTVSRVRKAAPTTLVTVNPQSQTVQFVSGSGFTTPETVIVDVVEGTSFYQYQESLINNSRFRITGVTNGTSSFGVVQPATPTTTSSLSGTISVEFRNSEGSIGNTTVNFNVGVAVQGENGTSGSDGATGPGIVFRGVWDSETTYNFSTDVGNGLGRRDAVLYDDVYYATKRATTGDQPDISADDWEELGTEDFFVAAKIAIFENSFIKETLNVGLNAEGNEANIAIVGGSVEPYIALGQSTQGYDNGGIFIGTDGGSQKLSLVGGTNSLNWDGTTLNIVGSIFATDGTIGGFTTDANTIQTDGLVLGKTGQPFAINAGNGSFTVTHTGEVFASNMTITGGGIDIGGGVFSVDSSGAVSTSNISITGGGININGGVFSVDSSGAVSASNMTITGGGININDIFVVNSSGDLTANSAIISGSISATDGTVGGWTINSNSLTGGSGATTIGLIPGNGIHLGNATFGSSPFRVTNAGALIATAATLTGTLSAGNVFIGTNDMSIEEGGNILFTNTHGNTPFASLGSNESSITVWFGGFEQTVTFYFARATGNWTFENETNFQDNISVDGTISATGNIIAFVSDERLKIINGNIENALEKIKSLNGFRYTFNETAKKIGYGKDDSIHLGVSAQEVEKILPEVVKPAPFDTIQYEGKTYSKTGEDYKTVQYEKLVPLLIEGIKELSQKVDELEKQIFKLKG